MDYDSESMVRGIPTFTFTVRNATYDTTLHENRGYRYENPEQKVSEHVARLERSCACTL